MNVPASKTKPAINNIRMVGENPAPMSPDATFSGTRSYANTQMNTFDIAMIIMIFALVRIEDRVAS